MPRFRNWGFRKRRPLPPRTGGGATEGSVTLRLDPLRGFHECSHECSRPAFIGGLDFGRSHSKTHTDLPYTKIRSRTGVRSPQDSQRGAGGQPSQTIHAPSFLCGHDAIQTVSAAPESVVKFHLIHKTCSGVRRYLRSTAWFASHSQPKEHLSLSWTDATL